MGGAEIAAGEALHPDPTRYVTAWTSADGTAVTIHPIRPEDEPLMIAFHQALSEQSVYLRYFHALKLSQRVTHERLTRICLIDYDRDMALVADREEPTTGEHEILGVGRLSKRPGTDEAEFALLIRDGFQGRGLGTALLRQLIAFARDERLLRVVADILPQNHIMQRIAAKLGFRLHMDRDSGVVRAELDLTDEAPGPAEAERPESGKENPGTRA
jgi:acetyltransferase